MNAPVFSGGGSRQSAPSRMSWELYDLSQTLVCLLLLFILCFTFLGRTTQVVGTSMVPTLHNGDRLIIYSLGYRPKQGDIVVLTKKNFLDEAIVKRVIAVGGQTVRIDYSTGTVSVDGTTLNEPYINELMTEPGYENIQTLTIPEGSVFVMGDNRNHSMDSRYVQLSSVDDRYILGHAVFTLFPFSRLGLIS